MRFCRPHLNSVYASLEGARCNGCHFVVGGVLNFIGCYGYLFLSGPFANFAAMHEFYGPVHLFPGDDETVRSFIGTHGWGFPYVYEQYLTDQSDSASEVNNRTRSLEPYQDTYLNFLNRNLLAPVLAIRETEEDRLIDSVLSLIDSDVLPVESAIDGSGSVPKSDIDKPNVE